MPNPFRPTTVRPDDFDAYWGRVSAELNALPIAAEEAELPLRSAEFCTAYTVHFTGIGPYRLFGYLSIPKGEGPFPTLLYLTRYQSVVEVIPQGDANEKRSRYIVFSLAARGQRNADRPYAASFPGIFTDGIEDPESYVFRGVVADCCRALEYLLTRPEVDPSRIVGIANTETPLLTAALRPGLTHLVATPSTFYATMDRNSLDEINDYLRLHPDRRDLVSRTLVYFDPLFFAPSVHLPTLLWGSPDFYAPLTEAMGENVQVRPSENSRYKDGVYQETWIARQFGFEDAILPAHWQ